MDPILLIPAALVVAWVATRDKKKKKKKTTKTTTPSEEPKALPPPQPLDIPPASPPPPTQPTPPPMDGPGGEEPFRPGGPSLPPPPTGPKPWPGPTDGPKPPSQWDPSPIEINPGTTLAEIEEHPNAEFGLYISSDCSTVFVGDRWWSDVMLPLARNLVMGNPDAFHSYVAVTHELLVRPDEDDNAAPTAIQACLAAWTEFRYGALTDYGTYNGYWRDGDEHEADQYQQWFAEQYPELENFLTNLGVALWSEPDLSYYFEQPWPEDSTLDEFDF